MNINHSTGNQSGDSWTNAITLLQPALYTAQAGDELWIAEGTYVAGANGFQIGNSVKLYGAFLGTEASVAGRRGLAANTILKGIASGGSKHVVSISGATGNPGVLLDSLTIREGRAVSTSGPQLKGGGIYAYNSDLDMKDCAIKSNHAESDGGGLYFEGAATFNTLHILSCVFDANDADNNGGALGGSLVNGDILNSQFLGNFTGYAHGGAMFLQTMGNSNLLTVANCTFWNNTAGSYNTSGQGGAVYLGQSAATTAGAANAKFVSCTMSDNKATACLAGQAVDVSANSQSAIYNCILAFNDNACGGMRDPIGGTSSVEYTDFWNPPYAVNHGGNGNIEADPSFHNHTGGGLTLSSGSACLDAADYDRLPPDLHDLDQDGLFIESLPLDLLFQKRFVDRVETNTGHASDGVHTYLDMGAHERP